jgi:hypothetical protein
MGEARSVVREQVITDQGQKRSYAVTTATLGHGPNYLCFQTACTMSHMGAACRKHALARLDNVNMPSNSQNQMCL